MTGLFKPIKLIGKVFAYMLLLFSYITPRSKRIWVYGSNMGFVGNAKYLFIYTSSLSDIKSIWIGANKNEVELVRNKGFIAYYRYSIYGIIYALISKVYIYNSYVNDINLYTFGFAKRINLWHGVGIKNCERKISTGPIAKIFRSNSLRIKLKYLTLFIKPHYFLSTSERMRGLFRESFAIRSNCFIDNMYPRCEILLMDEKDRSEFILKYENKETITLIDEVKSSTYSYLYMPTWRDSDSNFLEDFDFNSLNDILKERNEIFLIKLHPVTKMDIKLQYSNLILIDKYIDLNSVMSYTDCLITDFSSVYYDYIIMPEKRLILYLPDYEHYISKDRDLAFDYMECTEGEFVYNCRDLLSLIKNRDKQAQYSYQRIPDILNSFWGFALGTNTNDLYKKIKEKIGLLP
ncbi:MAG: CDP-glycerol glycerophosphotransferase family protein [Prevotellaceae bacterium]|nr:CDP-glycerol glycerophosphotransferase family protein [Prevotellaceae bacterium]